jgi:tetratricopeptide (TPR) repeat protein
VPSLADGFSARPETAADLVAALVAGVAVVLVPVRVAGERPGGWLESCGKTQLAVRVADALWQSRRVEVLVWITATNRAAVLSGYAEAAAAATGADPAGDTEETATSFAGWLGQTRRPWLVVLDDLRDPADLEGLYPAGRAGRVLITTPELAAFAGEQGTVIHPVGIFTPAEALGYLVKRLPAERADRRQAADLAGDLGYEPMALAQSSAVIANSALTCRDYRDYLARRWQEAKAGGQSPPAAAVTCAISAEHADRLAPGGSAEAVRHLAALLDGHAIPRAVFTTPAARAYLARKGGDDEQAREPERAGAALAASERAGLLSPDAAGGVALVRMSAAVQAAVRAAMPPESLDRSALVAADALLQAWPDDEQPPLLAGALRSCAASLQRSAGDVLWEGGCHPLLLRAGRSLQRAHLAGPALAYWQELAAVSDRILGPGHPDTLAVGERLAAAYLAADRAAEAVSWSRWVLAERVRVLGPDHPSAIAARRDLGRVLVAADEFGDAITVLDRVVSDYERDRDTGQAETLGAKDELADAYREAGQCTDAIRLYRETLAGREQAQGSEHPDTIATRDKLAGAYLSDGKAKEAISQYKRVLGYRERLLGPDHPDTIAIRSSLGSAYHAAGRMASAVQMYEQACAGYERALGADHPESLACRANRAHAYYDVGRVTDAVTLLRDALARSEKVLPPGDPLTATLRESLRNMAG